MKTTKDYIMYARNIQAINQWINSFRKHSMKRKKMLMLDSKIFDNTLIPLYWKMFPKKKFPIRPNRNVSILRMELI